MQSIINMKEHLKGIIVLDFQHFLTDGMTFEDFVEICRREPVTSEDDLMKAFRKIDLNGDGYISLDELFKIMTTVRSLISLSMSVFEKYIWEKKNTTCVY